MMAAGGADGGTALGPRLGITRKMVMGYTFACAMYLFGTKGGLKSAEGHGYDSASAVREPNPYSPASPEDYATILPRDATVGSYPAAYDPRSYAAADGTDASCDDILLFLPSSNVRTVEGQLGSYLVAVLAATFSDHALVVLDDAAEDLFGTGQRGSSGGGLASLIDHPDELSRRCPVPCAGTFGYDDWEARSWPGPVTPVLCSESTQNVLVVNGDTIAAYLASLTRDIKDRSTGEAVRDAFQWATRLGARADEASVFSTMTDGKEIMDYACGLLARSGLLRINPGFADDVASFVGEYGRGMHNWDAIVKTNDHIPLTDYLAKLSGECRHHEVYVATNATEDLREQIAGLPRHKEGPYMLDIQNEKCMTFSFGVVSPIHAVEPSWSLYQNTVLALSQLVMLARSRRLVADPGSGMYALLRFFRRRIRGSHGVMRSRSEGYKGGSEEGPTFIEGLVAVVEGEAEIYGVDPQSKYGEVHSWSDIDVDSLYVNGEEGEALVGLGGNPSNAVSKFDGGGFVQQEDDSPAIQFFVKTSGGEFFLNRAR